MQETAKSFQQTVEKEGEKYGKEIEEIGKRSSLSPEASLSVAMSPRVAKVGENF